MVKVKNLEKKAKPAAQFDKKNPENRKKSLTDAKLTKKLKAKDKKNDGMKNEVKIQKIQKKKKLKVLQQLKKDVEDSKTKSTIESVEKSEHLVNAEIIKKAVLAVKDGINKEIEKNDKKNLFDEELRLGLQIVATKIPQCPPHVRKILLTNSLFDQQPDVCFIIKDQIPKKSDQDENIRNFTDKLKELDINCVKTIIPLSKLKEDYTTHNLKLKLCNTYDVFLVESEIAEHAYTILGKNFIVKRKRPLQIDTKKTNVMKISIENALRKVSFKLNSTGNLSCFEIGTMKMQDSKIVENVMTAIDQLKEKWPGSWKNISRLYLKPMRPSKVTIPIYYSNINPNDIEVPVIQGAKQNRLDKLAEELKKKSKKLKLDLKKKRLVKTPVVNDKVKAEKVETKSEIAPLKTSAKKNKKDKKVKVVEETAPMETEEPVVKKKKNKQQPSKETVEEAVEPESEPAKKKKKKQKDVNLESQIDATSETAEIAAPQKKKTKNKNKSKSNVVDVNNDDTPAIVSEIKSQNPMKKNKKKDKKNKA